jgi:hypothetical protein
MDSDAKEFWHEHAANRKTVRTRGKA